MKSLVASGLVALAVLLGLPTTGHAQLLPQYQTHHLDGIAAVVEDDIILQSELEEAVDTVKEEFADEPQKLPPPNTLQHQVLDRLILQKLQVQRARDMGIRVSQDEVRRSMEGVAQQNNLTTQQLTEALASRGITVRSFQQQLAEQLLVTKLRQQILQQQVRVTDSEIDNLLDSPAFQAGEVHLAQITIKIPQGAGPNDIGMAQQKAAQVEQALASGMDFTAAAMRWSESQDALKGGDLGWHSLSELTPNFAQVLAEMQPGDVTPALRDPAGFHIFKLLEKRTSKPVMVTEYHARHLSIAIDALTTDAQAKAKITNLRKAIVDGRSEFAAVAQSESDDDTTASQGGDMGWFPLEGWGSAVARHIQVLKDGEVSEPFKAAGAWHIIQRLGEREEDRTVETRRDKARLAIENRKSRDVYENYLRQLRAEAYVDSRIPGSDDDSNKAS